MRNSFHLLAAVTTLLLVAPLHARESATPMPRPAPKAQVLLAEAEAPREPVAAALAELVRTADGETGARARRDRAAATEFYLRRDFAPVWIRDGRLTPQARQAIFRLRKADADGLDASRYRVPPLEIGIGRDASPSELASAELKLSLAILAYGRDASAGRVDPTSLGEFITVKPDYPDGTELLAEAASTADPAGYLDGLNPRHPGFLALREQLAELRSAGPTEPQVVIEPGPSIKPGKRDPRIPALRERLGVPAVVGQGADIYDEALRSAVASFQKQSDLTVDGIVGSQTRAALNGDLAATAADVLVNMERWRWLPDDMGGRHYVWVNVPEFRLRVVTEETVAFETRVIVGTAENQTPIFSDEIEYVDVNPYWNVPRSIATKEMLPEIQRDPTFFQRRGIEVLYTSGGRTQRVDPWSVDWRQWNASNMPFQFRQPPGDDNALGRVKFMFPNQHAVYLHDTPTKHLFDRVSRAFSHGCVRVENPIAFADALLAFEESINGERIKSLIGGGRNGALGLKRHVPVHLTYFTVWADEAGQLQRRPDIYGHDRKLKAVLGLEN